MFSTEVSKNSTILENLHFAKDLQTKQPSEVVSSIINYIYNNPEKNWKNLTLEQILKCNETKLKKFNELDRKKIYLERYEMLFFHNFRILDALCTNNPHLRIRNFALL